MRLMVVVGAAIVSCLQLCDDVCCVLVLLLCCLRWFVGDVVCLVLVVLFGRVAFICRCALLKCVAVAWHCGLFVFVAVFLLHVDVVCLVL